MAPHRAAIVPDDLPFIVVVEDEATQRELLVDYLSRHGFRVSGVDTGGALRQLMDREQPALVMLDVGLPGEDGFALARWMRERNARIGIIMVSAATDTVDRVVGLETGADDYIAKPFDARELLARVKSVLRRKTLEPGNTTPRRLAAILAADIAGYSRLVESDEEGTLDRLRALRQDRIDPKPAAYRGRIVKTTGDGILVEFISIVDAVRCAISLQRDLAASPLPPTQRIEYRLGINLGDIVVDGDDILGDSVNIAARLEGLAEPGGICLSAAAYDQVLGKIDAEFADIGQQQLRNIVRPVRAYRVLL
jgi:class 3 adenylate cyclase